MHTAAETWLSFCTQYNKILFRVITPITAYSMSFIIRCKLHYVLHIGCLKYYSVLTTACSLYTMSKILFGANCIMYLDV